MEHQLLYQFPATCINFNINWFATLNLAVFFTLLQKVFSEALGIFVSNNELLREIATQKPTETPTETTDITDGWNL